MIVIKSLTLPEISGFANVKAIEGGEAHSDSLFVSLYSQLHRLARCQLARHGLPISMTPTTLLHSAYIDIAERGGRFFPDNPRFIGYAARVMRGLIIDYVRNRRAQKRGGLVEKTPYNPGIEAVSLDDRELLLIRDALDELATLDESLADLVNLKFFCGFSVAEIAAMRNESERTVQRAWEKARIYLHQSIRPILPE